MYCTSTMGEVPSVQGTDTHSGQSLISRLLDLIIHLSSILEAKCTVLTEHVTNICQYCLGTRETKKARTGKDLEGLDTLYLKATTNQFISIKFSYDRRNQTQSG